MTMAVQLHKVKITGLEWYKSRPSAPFKISAENEEGEVIYLVFWGKTHPGIIESQEWYEAEISKITTSEHYGVQYTLARTKDEHGIKHMIKSDTKEKVKPLDVKIKSQAIKDTNIKILDKKWHKIKDHLYIINVRDLDTDFLDDAKLIFNGDNPPELKENQEVVMNVIKTISEEKGRSYVFRKMINSAPVKPQVSQDDLPEEKKEGPVKTEIIDPLSEEEQLTQIILDNLQRDSLNYVPGYKTYRASSINSCPRNFLLKKWERDLSPAALKKVVQIRKSIDYDRTRLGATWVGTAIHEWAENTMKASPIYVSSEEKITIEIDGIVIVGHYDLLIEIDGQKYVVDVKTTNPKYTNGSFEFKVDDHFNQLIVYQHALGGLPGLILYVERNNAKLTVFKQEYSKDKFNKSLNLFKKAAEYEERHELPMIPGKYGRDQFPCRKGEWQCEFWHVCWEGMK